MPVSSKLVSKPSLAAVIAPQRVAPGDAPAAHETLGPPGSAFHAVGPVEKIARGRRSQVPRRAVLVGGGLKDDNAAIYGALVALAKRGLPDGARPKLAVLPSSKSSLAAGRAVYFDDDDDGRPSLEKLFRQWGFDPVFVPLAIDDRSAAADPAYVALLDSCQGVWMTGGDQAKHARCLLNEDGSQTPLLAAVKKLQGRGGFVASGTSAGAAVQPPLIYGGGTSYEYLAANRLHRSATPLADLDGAGGLPGAIGPGIATLPEGVDAIVDTHLDRARLGRMVLALRETSARFAIGLSEDTGLFLEGTTGTVKGASGVVVLDRSDATFADDPKGLKVDGVRLHYLSDGDRFDFDNGRVLSARPRVLNLRAADDVDSTNIFRRHGGELERLLGALIRSDADQVRGRTAERDPGFELTFSKGSGYAGYGPSEDEGLTATRLRLDIAPL